MLTGRPDIGKAALVARHVHASDGHVRGGGSTSASAAPEQAVDAITACYRDFGAGKVAVVQALPGGSSATMISHQCAHYFSLDPMIALTKLDECEAMPAELSALAMDGSGIGLLTGTKSIVGGIAIATSQILTQYLRENA